MPATVEYKQHDNLYSDMY